MMRKLVTLLTFLLLILCLPSHAFASPDSLREPCAFIWRDPYCLKTKICLIASISTSWQRRHAGYQPEKPLSPMPVEQARGLPVGRQALGLQIGHGAGCGLGQAVSVRRTPPWLASGLRGAEWSKCQDLALGLGGRELLEQSSQVPVGIVSVGFGGFDDAE